MGAGIRPDKHESAHIDGRAPPPSKGISGLRGQSSRGSPPSYTRKGHKPSGFQTGDESFPPPGFGPGAAKGIESGIGSGSESGKARLPQPPGFVLHVVEVLRWLGVEGVTPEVLRKAKRGLREDDVVRGRNGVYREY